MAVRVTGTFVTESEKLALKNAFNLLLANCKVIHQSMAATNRQHRRKFQKKLRSVDLSWVEALTRAIGQNWTSEESDVPLEIHELTKSIYGVKLPNKQLPELLQDVEKARKLFSVRNSEAA